jgi:hypothetical protein
MGKSYELSLHSHWMQGVDVRIIESIFALETSKAKISNLRIAALTLEQTLEIPNYYSRSRIQEVLSVSNEGEAVKLVQEKLTQLNTSMIAHSQDISMNVLPFTITNTNGNGKKIPRGDGGPHNGQKRQSIDFRLIHSATTDAARVNRAV